MSLTALLHAFIGRVLRRNSADGPLEPALIEELLDDIDGGEKNLLPFSATQAPLKVKFKRWDNPAPTPDDEDTVTLYWDGVLVEAKTLVGPIADQELFIMVPERFLHQEGAHQVEYGVALYNGNTSDSLPLPIHIDRSPPQLAEDSSLLFDTQVIEHGVTDAYLQANGDRLLATIPAYDTAHPGDCVTWYWSKTHNGQDPVDLVDNHTLTQTDITKPLRIGFPGGLIRERGDGIRYAHYTIQDRARTPAQRSLPIPLQCNATPFPTDFSAPYLKETGSTGNSSTLDPARASNGASFVIKAQNNFEPTDRVEIFWAQPGDYGAYTAVVDVGAGDTECPIPKSNIAARMGSELVLYYQVTRRGAALTSTPHTLVVQAPRNLPHPQCAAIQGDKISLGSMGDSTPFTLTEWTLRDTSQCVKLQIIGVRKDGKNDPVVIAAATPVPSATGEMTVGQLTPKDLGVFEVGTWLEIEAFLSVDQQRSWMSFPYVNAQLVN